MEKQLREKYFKSMQRARYIGESCKDVKGHVNIRQHILQTLKGDGFDINHQGTQYLASLITLYFHERRLYRKYGERKNCEGYWNLNDWDNEHYGMLGNTKENVVYSILSAIGKNDMENGPIDELVYEIADSYIRSYDREEILDSEEKPIEYSKMLRK